MPQPSFNTQQPQAAPASAIPAAPAPQGQLLANQPQQMPQNGNVVNFNPVQPNQNPNNGGTLADLIHGRQQPPAQPAAPQPAPQANGLSPDAVAYIARMEAENHALRSQQGQAPAANPAQPAAPAIQYQYLEPVSLDPNVQTAMGNIYDPMNQVADARIQENLNPYLQQMNERDAEWQRRFDAITERMDTMRQTMFNNDLANIAPDLEAIKNHTGAREYFAQTNIDGTTYGQMLANAEKNNDVNAIGRITSAFKNWDAQRTQTQQQQQMVAPFNQQMPTHTLQQVQPEPGLNNPFAQPAIGQGDQAQSYVPSMPAQQQQGQVRMSDYTAKSDALDAAYMKAMQSGDKQRALEISAEREQLSDAALTAMDQGQIVPA